MIAHQQLLEKRTKGRIDVYFVGDSIARRWGATDYPEFLANWKQNFFGWNAADFGWGADRIEHILWRLENGELDGVNPKVIVILAGTNNVGAQPGGDGEGRDITRGLKALSTRAATRRRTRRSCSPRSFRATTTWRSMPEIVAINGNLAHLADGKKVRYLDVNDELADKDGVLFDGMMNARDKLHPTFKVSGVGRRAEADPHGCSARRRRPTRLRRRPAIQARAASGRVTAERRIPIPMPNPRPERRTPSAERRAPGPGPESSHPGSHSQLQNGRVRFTLDRAFSEAQARRSRTTGLDRAR